MSAANLEKVRQSLASKHAETVKESEKRMRILQQERQAVFQDAFQNDLKYYKEVGKIPSMFTSFIHLFTISIDRVKVFDLNFCFFICHI